MLGASSVFSLATAEGNMEARYSFKMLLRSFSMNSWEYQVLEGISFPAGPSGVDRAFKVR